MHSVKVTARQGLTDFVHKTNNNAKIVQKQKQPSRPHKRNVWLCNVHTTELQHQLQKPVTHTTPKSSRLFLF